MFMYKNKLVIIFSYKCKVYDISAGGMHTELVNNNV